MRHLKQLQLESKELEVFEVASLLRGFLEEKGIKANVEKFEHFFNIYISGYANEESPKKVPVQKLLTYFKSLGVSEDAAIQKTKFGYTIEMLQDSQSEKLMEAVVEEDEAQICTICEKPYFGYGNDPWPITTTPGERCCDQCNSEYVIPARLDLLNKKARREAVDRSSVEHAASNLVLDNKYIWLFSVLDVNGEDIEEGIEFLQDAIDSLVANDGTFLVAFPYVDPKPEDKSVELVFADNPGPVVIYNKEESTVAKGKLDRPSVERKPKGESTVTEATIDDSALVIDTLTKFKDRMTEEEYEKVTNAWRKLDEDMYELERYKKKAFENIKESGQAAPTEQQKAVQGINDVADYLKKHKASLSDKDLKTLIEYCRVLLKAVNKVAGAKTESTDMNAYGIKSTEDEAWKLYNKASKYFPDEQNALTDKEAVAFTKSAIEYIMLNFTEDDIDDILDGDNEQLYEVAEEIYDKALFYITDYLRESKSTKVENSELTNKKLTQLTEDKEDKEENKEKIEEATLEDIVKIPLGFTLTEEQAGIIDAVIGQSSDGIWENSTSKKNIAFWRSIEHPKAGESVLQFSSTNGDFRYYFPDKSVLSYIASKIKTIIRIYKEDNTSDYNGVIGYLSYRAKDGTYVKPSEEACVQLATSLKASSKGDK